MDPSYFLHLFRLGCEQARFPMHWSAAVAVVAAARSGRWWIAPVFGSALFVTHAFSVLSLGALAWYGAEALDQRDLADRTRPWMEVAAGVMTLGCAAWVAREDDSPTAKPSPWRDWLRTIILATAGGLSPAPHAFSALLWSFGMRKAAAGILGVWGFALGLALCLMAFAVVLMLARRAARAARPSRWRALLVAAPGVFMITKGVMGLLALNRGPFS